VSFAALFLISVVAGFIGAMAGMGGGVVLVPVLTFFGLPIKEVIAISIVSVIATSSGAASAYVRDHITNLKVGMFLEMFTMSGAIIGAMITVVTRQRYLYIMFGLVLLISWIVMWFNHGEFVPETIPDRFSRWLELHGSYYDQAAGKTIEYSARRAYLGGPMMFGAGLIAGLLGIGAGALKVLVMDLVMGLPAKVSTTTSNLIIGVTGLAGASVYLAAGLIHPELATPIIIGIVAGAFLGTRILVRLHNRTIHQFFLFILAILAIEMLYKGIRGL